MVSQVDEAEQSIRCLQVFVMPLRIDLCASLVVKKRKVRRICDRLLPSQPPLGSRQSPLLVEIRYLQVHTQKSAFLVPPLHTGTLPRYWFITVCLLVFGPVPPLHRRSRLNSL